jgi:hypothetical protein
MSGDAATRMIITVLLGINEEQIRQRTTSRFSRQWPGNGAIGAGNPRNQIFRNLLHDCAMFGGSKALGRRVNHEARQ